MQETVQETVQERVQKQRVPLVPLMQRATLTHLITLPAHTHTTHTHIRHCPREPFQKVQQRLADKTHRLDEEEYWQRKTRSGGAYVPPARLAQLQRALGERGSEAHQRVSWEALKKSLNGLINKLNVDNIKDILVELFGERGRHARSAVGMQSLPRSIAVEIEMIVQVSDA